MKNKKLLISIAVVVVVLLLAGGAYMFVKHNEASTPDSADSSSDLVLDNAIKLAPSDVGLTLTASANKKQVKFSLSKATGVTKIEYELSYEADSVGGTTGDDGDGSSGSSRITRGVAGDDTLDGSQSTYDSKVLDLGSCSSGTCRYDVGVTSVHLLLKLTKSDNKVYQVEQDLSLTK